MIIKAPATLLFLAGPRFSLVEHGGRCSSCCVKMTTTEDEETMKQLEVQRQQVLAQWKNMQQTGEMSKVRQLIEEEYEDETIEEQVEAYQEEWDRARGSGGKSKKRASVVGGGAKSLTDDDLLNRDDDDETDYNMMFADDDDDESAFLRRKAPPRAPPKKLVIDWRDPQIKVMPPRAFQKTTTTTKKELKHSNEQMELANILEGMGYQVAPPAAAAEGGGGGGEVAKGKTKAEEDKDKGMEQEDDYDIGMAIPNSYRGWMNAINNAEREERDAERIFKVTTAAARQYDIMNDQLYCGAIKALARLGWLEKAVQIEKVRMDLLSAGSLLRYNCDVSFGLAVACCRANRVHDAYVIMENLLARASDVPAVFKSEEGSGDIGDDNDELVKDVGMTSGGGGGGLTVAGIKSVIFPELLAMHLKLNNKGNKESGEDLLKQYASDEGADAVAAKETENAAMTNAKVTSLIGGVMQSTHILSMKCYNTFIRLLGKASRLDDVLTILDVMKLKEVKPDAETYEFLTNAFVKEVAFNQQAVSMKTLPTTGLPEVVFAGRSNVGKSSLVNMLVNRKALAPASDTPGETKHFNYYVVNKGRPGVPSFHLVDVPGLGFAMASWGRIDSWRSTLQRYIAVRENLKTIFHLVDSRVGMQAADVDLMQMVKEYNVGPKNSEYIIVLTKCDKTSKEKASKVAASVMDTLAKAGIEAEWERKGQPSNSDSDGIDGDDVISSSSTASSSPSSSSLSSSSRVKVIMSSAKTKLGRDELWRSLFSAVR